MVLFYTPIRKASLLPPPPATSTPSTPHQQRAEVLLPSPQKSESKHPSASSQHPSSSSKHPFASSQPPSQNSPHPHLASAQDFSPDHFVNDSETDEEHQTLLCLPSLHGITPPDNLDEEFDPGQYDEEDDNYDDMDLSTFQSRAALKSTVEAL